MIMKGIDYKSAVIGLLLGACLILALGAGGKGDADLGRYRISAVGYPSSACYVIDSTTGRMWIRRSNTQGSFMGSPDEWEQR